MRLGILTSHPIQYQAPWFRGLAKKTELEVFFAHRPDATQQGEGFGKSFSWDVDLLSGYKHRFLKNVAAQPGTNRFNGCDTPEIRKIIGSRGRSPHRFDAFIVTGWHLKSYWQAIRASRRARVPVFVRGDSQLLTPRSMLKRWGKEIIYRWMLKQFDGFLVVGQRNREYLAHYGVSAKKMFFAPHFVDNEWFAAKAAEARSQKSEVRRKWGIPEDAFCALFCGKFISKKRPLDLLRALAILQKAGLPIWGIFVGSGELEKTLKEMVQKENLSVHFAGFKNQTELPACYVGADVLVLPSEGGETWGLVVNEAMACGLPAIVSDAVGCAPDLIEDGKTGFTFPVGNCEQLAKRIELFLNLKKCGHDFAPALAEKTRAFDVEAAVNGTIQALRKTASV